MFSFNKELLTSGRAKSARASSRKILMAEIGKIYGGNREKRILSVDYLRYALKI